MALINDNEALLKEYDSWRGDSLESLVPNALSRKLSGVLASAGRTLAFVGTEFPKQARLLLRPNYDTERVLKEVNYATAMKLTVPCLTGLKTTYHSFALCLNADVLFLQDIIEECLKPADRVLNQLYGTPEELRGTLAYPEFDRLANRYKKMVELRKQLGDCFEKNSHKTYADFGSVFGSNGEVKATEDLIRELGKNVDKINIDDVRKKMKQVEASANDLHKLINTKDEFLPSSFMASKITEMLFNVAEECEFLGAVLTQHQALFNTFQELQQQLAKKLK